MVLGEVAPSNRSSRRKSAWRPKTIVAISACVAIVFVFSVVNTSGTTRFTQLVAALSPELQLKVASTQAKAATSEAKAADAQAKAAAAETAEAMSKVAVAEAKAAEAEARAALVEALVGENATTTAHVAAATTAALVATTAAATHATTDAAVTHAATTAAAATHAAVTAAGAATTHQAAATHAAVTAAGAATTHQAAGAHPTHQENEGDQHKEKDMAIGVRFFNPECRESLMEMGRQMRNQSCTNAEQVAADILFGLAFKTGTDPDTVREFCRTPCIERIVVIASKTVKIACDLQGSRTYFAKIMEACPEHLTTAAAGAAPTAAH